MAREKVVILGAGKLEENKELTITENGQHTILPTQGKTMAKVLVNVNVPQGVNPSGIITIRENGLVNVKNYASAKVNVPTYIEVVSESNLPTEASEGTIAIVTGE